MSHNWSNLTGGLVYNGEPVVTPVIKGLFGPLALSGPDEALTEVQVTESVSPSWRSIMESLLDELAINCEFEDDIEELDALVSYVKARFGNLAADKLQKALGEGLASEADADVQDLGELALLMQDGHNLRSVWTQGAWGGDRIEAGVFGGWAQFESGNVSLTMNTQRLCEIAESMEQVCQQGTKSEQTVAQALERLDMVAGGCIRDGVARANFRRAMANWLI